MRVVKRTRFIGWLVALSVLAACGDDDGDGDDSDDGMGHPHVDGSLPEAPCPEETPEFRIGLQATGEEGSIVAELIDADRVPPRKDENDWTIEFQDPDGNALEDAELTMARPFMPVHGHDGMYPPEVDPLDNPGQFQVDNLNLWMTGPWQVQLTVASESAGDDYVVFHVCVD